jgi:hypothetical protein
LLSTRCFGLRTLTFVSIGWMESTR